MYNPIDASRIQHFALGRFNLKQTIETLIDPLALFSTVIFCGLAIESHLSTATLITAILIFALYYPGQQRLKNHFFRSLLDILVKWLTISVLLFLLAVATNTYDSVPLPLIYAWLIAGPLVQISAHVIFKHFLNSSKKANPKAIIVGLNKHGIELSRIVTSCPYNKVEVLGFIDDRKSQRESHETNLTLLGNTDDLAEYCNRNSIQKVFLTLPMTTQPRTLKILDSLQDSTASIYFVPDLFVTDLIQGHVQQIGNMPIVSVRDTPFSGTNGLIKRATDCILAAIILVIILPILVSIGIAIKATSPGPIIFKQRRFGLDGQEITVYKFRTMTVCEDGPVVKQATQNDNRITPLGRYLRRYSLDELPQFINVLQGNMSIVGPRPHAIAHNEEYRKLIKGYMIRHKVKPGITGWAQINGFRGETQEIEKMQARITYDIDYLRNWSLLLDLKIILSTILILPKDPSAY